MITVVLFETTRINETVVAEEGTEIGESLKAQNVSIGKKCKIGHHVTIKQNTFLGDRVIIGDDVFVGEGVIIEDGARVGQNVVIGDFVTIKKNAIIRSNCSIPSKMKIDAGLVLKKSPSMFLHGEVGEPIYWDSPTEIRIGICCLPVERWREQFQIILGKAASWTQETIDIYKAYFDFLVKEGHPFEIKKTSPHRKTKAKKKGEKET